MKIGVIILFAFMGKALGIGCYTGYYVCDNGNCVYPSFVCNGNDDCGDGSDEFGEDCPACNPYGSFECDNGKCIEGYSYCDRYDHCGDGSDERNCPSCNPYTEWECDNGNCIQLYYTCNRHDNCGDNSDENPDICAACTDVEFTCANRQCVPIGWICDGDDDCGDGSDEYDEATGQCPACPFFKCVTSGRCLQNIFTCDGLNHCDDWSDEAEEMCPCADGHLRCSKSPEYLEPGACIPPELICDEDGIWDCPFGDDEANCTQRAKSPKPNGKMRNSPRKVHKVPTIPNVSKLSKNGTIFKFKKNGGIAK